MQPSPVSCHFISLRAKYSLQHPVFNSYTVFNVSCFKVYSHFASTLKLQEKAKQGTGTNHVLASCLPYSSDMKMEVIYSSEISIAFQRTAPSCIQERGGLLLVLFVSAHELNDFVLLRAWSASCPKRIVRTPFPAGAFVGSLGK
jgi:hypothetical protein